MNHIALLMENQPGALSRVIGLFSQRGYNIDSLSVAPTQDETLSRLTMTIGEEGADINQILKQLYKLVDVVMVQNLAEADGSRDNLPPPADAPEQFGLGIKREEPKHY